MKPVIQTLKNMKRRITGYRASFGPVSVDVKSSLPYPKQVAAEALEKALRETLARVEQGAVVVQWTPPIPGAQQETIVVWPAIEGWGGWCSVFSSGSYSEFSGGARESLVTSLVQHVMQQAWTVDIDDEALIASVPTWSGQAPTTRTTLQKELRSYFHWQREYRRLRAKGFDDKTARNILGGVQKEE